MSISRIVLSPFSALYRVVTDMRNFLYNQGRRHSVAFIVPVINVGNLTVGGTGKSPMIEYLAGMLSREYHVATLSRGYGRRTKGFRLAGPDDDATTLGDEPLQFYKKLGDKITVAVGEERALAIPSILLERPATEVVLLDDAYQHRAVTPHVNILLNDYNRPFYEDTVLPGGRLRESRHGARRAHAVVVTKCPAELPGQERARIREAIGKYTSPGVPVFFTTIDYASPVPLYGDTVPESGAAVLAFSGIARSQPFTQYLADTFKLVGHINFPDHHTYTKNDLEKILKEYESKKATHPGLALVTTEKDAVRLQEGTLRDLPVSYIPIRPAFLSDEEKFQRMIFDAVAKELGR
ncbi:MAG: tetraacyldisaccharide 4'-kinase [Cyclobacteriaceae bacterium]